jgi:Na+(H+)/acetate symporter ActP
MTPLLALTVDPWILAFSAVTVLATIWMGFRSAKSSKTASDFFVAGRSVGVGMNASAISGEYLSAASFMGVAGMVMSSGYDALWYPVCYACGYLFLLLFIAGPLRRFGAYTIPDFAEGRFDSPVFRKIAVVFVLFIGFFYTMPQMKGAGTTLSYIFQGLDFRETVFSFLAPHGAAGEALPGLNYSIGVLVVGAVITLNVALGGMKGITLVQAFQYWAKMFAISVPVFVLMAVYGNYGKQVGVNAQNDQRVVAQSDQEMQWEEFYDPKRDLVLGAIPTGAKAGNTVVPAPQPGMHYSLSLLLRDCAQYTGKRYKASTNASRLLPPTLPFTNALPAAQWVVEVEKVLTNWGYLVIHEPGVTKVVAPYEVTQTVVGTARRQSLPAKAPKDETWLNPFGPLTTKAAKAANLSADQTKPLSLLYTYSLIIALVCGTAGLPHILVRFYTNPDGVAAKRTTMWVMILIGVFYLFPPVFGVMGRNLMPDLYNGLAGVKGTDGIVLKLPKLLNDRFGVLGSVLSGVTCAGAFAAFMSTFSGLLVSMTGALAHDVYGRILRPKSTADERMKMFKLCAVICGLGAMLLGFLVESFEINKMVGWAFAIAATSYFPLLFLSTWWRGITMKGAATGMLVGGTTSLVAIASTMFADQAAWAAGLKTWYAGHPLARILAEQPAIWALPLAMGLMYFISKLTAKEVPADIRMKMLVLHAPEKLGLKQEYIQEHQAGH